MEESRDSIADMKERLAKASTQLAELNSVLDTNAKQIADKQAEIKSKEDALDSEGLKLQQRSKEIKARIQALQARTSTYEANDSQLTKEEAAFNESINQYNARATKYEDTAERFQDTWARYLDALSQGADHSPEIEEAKAALDYEGQQLTQLQATLGTQQKSLENRRGALNTEYDSMEQENQAIVTANDDLEKAVTIHNTDFDNVAKEKQDLKTFMDAQLPLQSKKNELTLLIDQLQKSIAAAEQGDKYDVSDANVVLPEGLKAIISGVARQFFMKTQKRLVITSGLRTPAKQANAMYDKLARGEDIVALYHDKDAAKAIKKAYDENHNKPSNEVIAAMTKVIETQVSNKIYISRHLSGAAFDISMNGMTAADKTALREVIQQSSDLSLIDNEAGPAHFHVASKMLGLRLSNLASTLMPLNFLTVNNRNSIATLRENMPERISSSSICLPSRFAPK